MTRIAVPVFRKRISPVFDNCTRLLVLDLEDRREIDRKEIYLDALSASERLAMLHKLGVSVVICGGISQMLENMLVATHISVISDITGDIEAVAAAYTTGQLHDGRFHLSGGENHAH